MGRRGVDVLGTGASGVGEGTSVELVGLGGRDAFPAQGGEVSVCVRGK